MHAMDNNVSVMDTSKKICSGCGELINTKHLLRALDRNWHEECLKCGCCDCRLGEVGNSLYTKGNLLLCRRDYLRLFGSTGYCAACNKVIPAFELVMRARNNVYHLECFACQHCTYRFCVGEQFFLVNNKILCKKDYHHLSTSNHSSPLPTYYQEHKRPLAELPSNYSIDQLQGLKGARGQQTLSGLQNLGKEDKTQRGEIQQQH